VSEPGETRTVVVCPVADLPIGEVATAVDPSVGAIAVFNADGELFAINDRCTHEKASLSDGFLEGCTIECPLHASLFDLRTGVPDGPPATVAVATYPVRIEDGVIVVDLEMR
jgi:3-phenylpropionate/trans-cinnamate dioxygenase ferredoxin subunit/ethylbenzene dioxygenase ferredoxin subunit